jgi:hypothetical protein
MNCHKTLPALKHYYSEYKAFYDEQKYKAVGWDRLPKLYKRSLKWVRIHNLPDFVSNHSTPLLQV